jgi:hypothetical protein
MVVNGKIWGSLVPEMKYLGIITPGKDSRIRDRCGKQLLWPEALVRTPTFHGITPQAMDENDTVTYLANTLLDVSTSSLYDCTKWVC